VHQLSDIPFFERAVEAMAQSEGRVKVGAVIVHAGRIVATGTKRDGVHAERDAIEQAKALGVPLAQATLYTTLEPCVELTPHQRQESCSALIIREGIREVVIGRYDPNPLITRRGWRMLRDAGVHLHDFPAPYRNQIDDINGQLMACFESGVGPTGGAKVDHRDGAAFCVRFSDVDPREIDIAWSICSGTAVYGVGNGPVSVALARYAKDFDEIDDPSAFDFGPHARIGTNEIGIFKGPGGFVLVQPTEIRLAGKMRWLMSPKRCMTADSPKALQSKASWSPDVSCISSTITSGNRFCGVAIAVDHGVPMISGACRRPCRRSVCDGPDSPTLRGGHAVVSTCACAMLNHRLDATGPWPISPAHCW
jgi:diaminohydroxyphosphoribosylaminopyrimidine deaminase / 5-amino-6-(5-phosphoribosylamino)uracil reductase